MLEKISKSDEEWRRILTPEQYEITQKKGTEPPFTGKYHDFKGSGILNVYVVEITFLVPRQSTIQELVGLVFGHRFQTKALKRLLIIA